MRYVLYSWFLRPARTLRSLNEIVRLDVGNEVRTWDRPNPGALGTRDVRRRHYKIRGLVSRRAEEGQSPNLVNTFSRCRRKRLEWTVGRPEATGLFKRY